MTEHSRRVMNNQHEEQQSRARYVREKRMTRPDQVDLKLPILRLVRDQDRSQGLSSDALRDQIELIFKIELEEGNSLGDVIGETKEQLRDVAGLITYKRGSHCLTPKGEAVLTEIEEMLDGKNVRPL